jgi:hypothetical protein
VFPVEIIASGLIRWTIPSGYFESVNRRSDARKQGLLNGTRNSEIMLHFLELMPSFSFAQSHFHMFSNFGADGSSHEATRH